MANEELRIVPPYYPIVYVRGYAMTRSEREDVFNDAYYGFSANSVEVRQAPPPKFKEVDIFEGQFIRFMKLKHYAYFDATNEGLEDCSDNPSRSIWICRFYDQDYLEKKLRNIEEHAEELRTLVCTKIPKRLEECGVNLGPQRKDYKVILIAHSMGGLVCRTLIQNLLPAKREDPKRWVHRLVTLGTPHRGIDLGAVPNFLEEMVASALNPFDSGIFQEKRMRQYLKLSQKDSKGKFVYDVHSLGDTTGPYAFPVKRCLCIIGSNHTDYTVARHATGGFSDGLVKQDRAYVVAGKAATSDRPKQDRSPQYPEAQQAFYANVHRAHSGYRGIVNSYESFENIHRFLFGNVMASASLENLAIRTPKERGFDYFYDFEFSLSIRGTAIYLHRRKQEPCENAMRFARDEVPKRLELHTTFLNTGLRPQGDAYSHFTVSLRVAERRVRKALLLGWDREYPEREIYSEMLEIRLHGDNADAVQYRWMTEEGDWKDAEHNGAYFTPLREASSLSARLRIEAKPWPDPALTLD